MNVRIFNDAHAATIAACDWLSERLTRSDVRSVMVAGGNTPLALYARLAERKLRLDHLDVFALDEYIGVPTDHPRNCANLLRRSVVQAWRMPDGHFFALSSDEREAERGIAEHEAAIARRGGLDLVILGLGRNGHLGFNEPGSAADSPGRVVTLSQCSVDANREWFDGQWAPARGVTTGLQTILNSRTALLLAFGAAKADAVAAMVEQPPSESCPASFLQQHPDAWVLLDESAAAQLAGRAPDATATA
jgi:glucosamine-6-phosphate deaminase